MKKITKICLPIAAAAMVGGGMVPLISCKTDTGQYDNVKLSYDSKAIKIISVDKVFGEDLVVKYDEINPNYNYSKPTVKVAGEDAPFAWDADLKTIAIDRDLLTTNDISVEIDFNTTGKNYVEENVVVNGEHCTLGSVSGSFGEDMVVTIGIDQDGYVIDACNVTVGDVYVEDPQMSDGHIVTIPAHYFSKYNETVSIGVTITGREIKVEAIAEEDSHFTLSVRQHKWGEDIIAYAETTASFQFTGEYEVHIGSATGPTVEAQNIDNEIIIPWDNLQGKITYTDHIFIKVYTIGRPFEYVVNDGRIVTGLTYNVTQNEFDKDFRIEYHIQPGYQLLDGGISVKYVSREGTDDLEFDIEGDDHDGTIVVAAAVLTDHRWELHFTIQIEGKEIPVNWANDGKGLIIGDIVHVWGQDVVAEVSIDDNYERTTADITALVENPTSGYSHTYMTSIVGGKITADFVWFETAGAGSQVTFDVPVQGKTLTNVTCNPKETPESGIHYEEIIKRFGQPVTVRYSIDYNHELSGNPTATVNGQEVTVLGSEGNNFISADVVTSYTDEIIFNFPVVAKHYNNVHANEYVGLTTTVASDVEYGKDIEVSFEIDDNYELDQTKKVTAKIDGTETVFTPVDNAFTIPASLIPKFDSEVIIDIPVKGRGLTVNVEADENAISYQLVPYVFGEQVRLTDFKLNPNYVKAGDWTYQIGDRLPKPVIFEAEDTIVTLDPTDIVDADEVITFAFPTKGQQLNPKFSGTDGVEYTIEQAAYGQDIIINYEVKHGYEWKNKITATYESAPLHVEEETGSDDVITATIKFDKTVITDYSKDIVIQFSVDPLDYENVTINNQAFVDSEGLKANVIQKTYGSDVKINYKIDSNYWIKGDETGKKLSVYYGDSPVSKQIDGDPYDETSGATITVRSAVIPDYQVHIDAVIDVEGKPLENLTITPDSGITITRPEAIFGQDLVIPFEVDITKFSKGDFDINVPYDEEYDPETGVGAITVLKKDITSYDQDIKITLKSIAKGISVSYVSYPGLITPEVPEFADLERGVRFTFDVKSYYKEDSDNIYARIKEVGGSWGDWFKPDRSGEKHRTVFVAPSKFEGKLPVIEFDIPVLGEELTGIQVHEGKGQTPTGGLEYEIVRNEYNQDIEIGYSFKDDYELNGSTTDIKYSINGGSLQPVKSATDNLITIAASTAIRPETPVDVYIPTVGKQLSALTINTDAAEGFAITGKTDRFNDDIVLNYTLDNNHQFSGDQIAKVREGDETRTVVGRIDSEQHTITFKKEALDLHTHGDKVVITIVTQLKNYSGIVVNTTPNVHYTIPTDAKFGDDITITYYFDAGYELDEAGITAKVDEVPVEVINVEPTVDEPVGQVTLTFTEMSDKVPTVAFDSDIVFNIPVKGQSFTNVHINSGDGFRGITLSEMTAIYGEDLVAKYDVNSSYDADLAEAYFQVGTEGTHVSIIAEDGTITIPWAKLAEQLAGYEDPTAAEIIISIPTEGKQMTDIQVYGGVTCDTSGAKFDADGGINLTYELKEGRVRTEDDITLSVQGKDIESGELTWSVDETTQTISISREMFKAHGEEEPIIKSYEDVIIINVPTDGIKFEVAWNEGCHIDDVDLPEWEWGKNYAAAYTVEDNYLRNDGEEEITVLIDGLEVTGEGITETVEEDKKSGEFTISWSLVYDALKTPGDHTIAIDVPTEGDTYKDTEVTDNQGGEVEVISGSFTQAQYGKAVVATCEFTDENWELQEETLEDNFSASIGGEDIEISVQQSDDKYEVTIAHSTIEATGKGVYDKISIVVKVKPKSWTGSIDWVENEDVNKIELEGSPKYNDDITVTITLEAGCEFDGDVTATVVGGTEGSITATREGNKFTLAKEDLAAHEFKHNSGLEFTVPTKHSELNIGTPVYDSNAITLVGEITGTYGDDLSFKFKLNSNYSLGDVTAAGGGTAATAVISGPDADDNYTASFTASQIKGALSEPSAELTITISTEANDWNGSVKQNEEQENDDVKTLTRTASTVKFNQDITGTIELKPGCSFAGSEHDVVAQVDGTGTSLDVTVSGTEWTLTKEALAGAGFNYDSDLVFTIKTKHDQLHIEKGEIGTGVQVSGDITGTYGDAIVFDYTVTDANYEVTKIQAKTESGSFSSPSVQHESGNVYTVTFDWDDIEDILASTSDQITISIETQGKAYTKVSAVAAEGQEGSMVIEEIVQKHYGENIVIEFTISDVGMQLSRNSTITIGEGDEAETYLLSTALTDGWVTADTDLSGKITLTIKFANIPYGHDFNFDTLVKVTIGLDPVEP